MLPVWAAPVSPCLSLPGSKQKQRRELALPACSFHVKQHENASVGGSSSLGQAHAPATSPCSHAQPQETHSSSKLLVPRAGSPLFRATTRQHSGMVLGQLPALPAGCQGTGVPHTSASIAGPTAEPAECPKLVKIVVMELQRGGRADCKALVQLLQKTFQSSEPSMAP